MRKFTFFWFLLLAIGFSVKAQVNSAGLTAAEQAEINASANFTSNGTTIDVLLQRLNQISNSSESITRFFSNEEIRMLQAHFRSQNRNPEADIIPTAGATETFSVATGDFFFDPGGPGGSSTGGTPGNYPNCGCVTTTTLDGANEITFTFFSVFATFDWLKIYDGADTTGTILFDNATGGANQGDITLADMIASNGSAVFTSTTGSLTFEFNATAVVDYGGWEVEITDGTGGGGGGGGGGPVTAYGYESQSISFGSFASAAPQVYTVINTSPNDPAADFEGAGAIDPNGDGSVAYALTSTTSTLYSIDVATGTYTSLGTVSPPAGESWVGLEFDPSTGTLYGLSGVFNVNSTLSVIDIGALTATPVGGPTGIITAVTFAIDASGVGYATDVSTDSLYSIDLSTGAGTLVGAVGIDLNFGQGMTYDPNTDQIYTSAFNNGSFLTEWRIVNTATGATTLVGVVNDPTISQVAWVGIPNTTVAPIDCTSTTYDAPGVPFDIDGAATSTADCAGAPNLIPVNVPNIGVIGTDGLIESVTIDITHTWSGDLEITLVSPTGTELILADNLSGNTDNAYNGTVFEDGGADIVQFDNDNPAGVQFGVGPYAPQGGSFSVFNGEDLNGDWSLKICDTAGGDSGQVLQFTLGVCTPPTNDECEDAFEIACGDVFVGETITDTDSGSNPANDEWFSFTGDGDPKIVTLSLCDGGTDYDSLLRVFDACGGNEIAVNDDACGLQSELSFYSDGTSTYYIMVEGFSSASGNFSLAVTCVDPEPNDLCDGAISIDCGETILGSTTNATFDANAGDCGTPVTSPGVWYIFEDTSGLASDYVVSLCDGGTAYDSKLSVYTGDCNNLVCVDGNDDSCGLQSEVGFSGDGNTTYYILVHGFGGATGDFSLNLTCIPIPPDNDEIANAISLNDVGCPFTDEDVAMPAATTEGGNPTNCDISGANGVWYKFTPEGDGFIRGTIGTPAGFSSVTFYTAPDENSSEDDLVLVDYFENQCLPSETARIPYVAGQTYYAFVVNSGSITDIIFDECETLGVAGNEIEGFAFYPNPANEMINFTSSEIIDSVAIYTILGQEVISQDINATSSELNITTLATGAYVMKVTVNGQVGTYKLIKE